MYVGITRAQRSLRLSWCRAPETRRRIGRVLRLRASSASSRRRICAGAGAPASRRRGRGARKAYGQRAPGADLKAMLAR